MFIIAHEDGCSLMESISQTASVPDLHARMGEPSPQIRVSTICTCTPKRFDLVKLIKHVTGSEMPAHVAENAMMYSEVPRG